MKPVRSRAHAFSHFADVHIFLGPGRTPSTVRDRKPPGGPSIFGALTLGTGCQEILRIHKMGKGSTRVRLDSHPGDAVLIAPVSRQIPWYQGILQGILLFWGSEAGFRCKKPLSCSDFSGNSLLKLTGKIFRRSGNILAITGNFKATEAFEKSLQPMSIQCPLWNCRLNRSTQRRR